MIKTYIRDLDSEGNGIGIVDQRVVFVTGAILGETCEIEITKESKRYFEAKKIKTIKESNLYKKPFCEKFGECGGCTIQYLTYEKQCELKVNRVKNDLQRIGRTEIQDIPMIKNPNPTYFRNKIELKMEGNKLGYYAKNSHEIVEIDHCPVARKPINLFIPYLKALLLKYQITGWDRQKNKGLIKNITLRANGQGELQLTITASSAFKMDAFFSELKEYDSLIECYLSVNKNPRHERMGSCKQIFSKKEFQDRIGKYTFRISPRSFFQVNAYNTSRLYDKALDFLKNTSKGPLLDLYAGIGTTTICFSEHFNSITAVEILEDAVKDSEYNKKLNHIKNITFLLGKSEEKIKDVLKDSYKALLVDPPRKGLDQKLIDIIGKSKIPTICYISCNPATLARDVARLKEYGFHLSKIAACDMFSQTMHVETVALLSKLDVDKHIDVEITHEED